MTRSFWGRLAGAAVAVAMAFTLAPAASAAPSRPSGTDDATANQVKLLTGEDTAAIRAKAVVDGFGKWDDFDYCDGENWLKPVRDGGQLWCTPGRYAIRLYTWDTGRREFFGVGSDWATYHNFEIEPNGRWSGWNSLGGNATGGVHPGSDVNGFPRLWVYGTDYKGYCAHYAPNPSRWERWYPC